MLTPSGGAVLKSALISRRELEHNSPAFGTAGRRLGSFDYTMLLTILSCLIMARPRCLSLFTSHDLKSVSLISIHNLEMTRSRNPKHQQNNEGGDLCMFLLSLYANKCCFDEGKKGRKFHGFYG